MGLLKQAKISHVVLLNSYFCKQNQNRACVAKVDNTDL